MDKLIEEWYDRDVANAALEAVSCLLALLKFSLVFFPGS